MITKILTVTFLEKFSEEENSEKFLALEELLLSLGKDLSYDFSDEKILVFNNAFENKNSVTFADYVEEWKILKNFLIENNLANEENYKQFFSLVEQDASSKNPQKSGDELDSLIAKVDKNDPKLLDVLSQISRIKK